MRQVDVPIGVLERAVGRAAAAVGVPEGEPRAAAEALIIDARLRWQDHPCWDEGAAVSQAWGAVLDTIVTAASAESLDLWDQFMQAVQP